MYVELVMTRHKVCYGLTLEAKAKSTVTLLIQETLIVVLHDTNNL